MRTTIVAAAGAAALTGALVAMASGDRGGAVVAGAVIGLVIGAVGGLIGARSQRRQLRSLAGQVRQWPQQEGPRHLDGKLVDPALRELASALTSVGAELDRGSAEHQRGLRSELVNALSSPALVFDVDGQLMTANRAARELLALPSPAPPMSVIQTLGNVSLAEAVTNVEAEDAQLDVELGARHIHAVISRVGDDTLVVLTDRTRERRVEELRRDFVVNASHELKTPATAIQTLSEALEITAVNSPDRVPDLVARLREESERLVRLVHDLLSLRRLEDRPAIDPVRFDLADTLRDVVADLDERARGRSVELFLEAPESATIAAEPDDVRLIVRNLVANAIQYNQEGGEVRVTLRRDGPSWLIEVADTGIGIPQADLPRIFERFYRVDVARSRQTGGTGLGLSIVRHAVERHGGSIEVDSLLGQGTTFEVRLPIDAA